MIYIVIVKLSSMLLSVHPQQATNTELKQSRDLLENVRNNLKNVHILQGINLN